MTKIWYGHQTDKQGYVYTRFVTLTEQQTQTALKIIKENNGYLKTDKNSVEDMYRQSTIHKIGKYLFLNNTQSKILGVHKHGYNTAIYVKN